MRWYLYLFFGLLVIMFAGPISVLLTGKVQLNKDWQHADRSSAQLAPSPLKTTEAVVQIYAARTFNWRGMFAVHSWIAVKSKNAKHYIIYQSLGWNYYYKKPFVEAVEGTPDASWFGQKPQVLLDLRGERASIVIKKIKLAVIRYPYKNRYSVWPGPNSNTFVAYIIRNIPGMHIALPVTAIGKDYLPKNKFFVKSASGTGYQFSWFGLFGVTIALREGVEFNVLGISFGASLFPPLLNLPGYGII